MSALNKWPWILVVMHLIPKALQVWVNYDNHFMTVEQKDTPPSDKAMRGYEKSKTAAAEERYMRYSDPSTLL